MTDESKKTFGTTTPMKRAAQPVEVSTSTDHLAAARDKLEWTPMGPTGGLLLLTTIFLAYGVFRYLLPQQIIRLRLTCTRFYAVTHLRIVWLNALEKLRRTQALPLPYPSRSIHSLNAHELEVSVVKMVTLDKNFTKHRAKPISVRSFNAPGRISWMGLIAGGEWMLTADVERLMCWDLAHPTPSAAPVHKLAPVPVTGSDQGYSEICVRNVQYQLYSEGDEAIISAYMSYDSHPTMVWTDKVTVWRITGLSRRAQLTSTFMTQLCFPDYAPEYGMSDLSGDWIAFLGREHDTPIISITNWRTGKDNEFDQARFRPDFSSVTAPPEQIRVQGIKLICPYVMVVASSIIAVFLIPASERVKDLCGDAPRLKPLQIYRFNTRAPVLLGEFVGFCQSSPIFSPSSTLGPISFLTSRAKVTLVPFIKAEEQNPGPFVMPPSVTRLRAWTHRASKPTILGPSGTRGIWLQRIAGFRSRVIAWTTARDETDDLNNPPNVEGEGRDADTVESEHETRQSATVAPLTMTWSHNDAPDESFTLRWNELPCGKARKVDMYPVKVDTVKSIAFDEGTGRTCLGMSNGEIQVLDFA
ncbi:hypothetical protein Clacol_007731 [Clathrus columnatus]|uniref:Uncharacterized protein n=1 Tax=Clathrus columnatus TaxID=1419009 RepID=A0AAV5AI91_9AGAM|nr:hypothetical protein Clacol_007731 [Clathrus columnatus]